MSINGLRFSLERHSSAPLETKSGSYIYTGDASNFHDWSFRTLLRIRLYEQQLEDRKSADPEGTSALPIPTEADEEPEEPMTFPDLSGETTAQPPTPGSTPKAGASPKSPKKTKSSDGDRGPLVNRVIEGLRGDAFSIARDLGLEVLSAPGGLIRLVNEIKAHVFPRAKEEAKELFRAGQKQGGPLSRQPSEPMLSYVQRRRRWWAMLRELDDSMEFSDSLRTELMLELSGLNRQEILVVKACANTKDFEGIAKVLVENYSGIHLREGSRSWTGRGNQPFTGKSTGKGYNNSKGKGYVKGSQPRAAYNAYPDEGEEYHEHWEEHEEHWHEESLVGLLGDVAEEEPEDLNTNHDCEYHDDVDEYEAVALNAMLELDGAEDERQTGEAIQLQLVAMVAFGKAKGKGNPKGKGKGKGKLVRSHLTLDQRRSKLAELKSKSKCMRCGVIGHWAGDPGCKFSGSKGAPKPAVKPTANFGDMSDSSEEDGITLSASPGRHGATAMMAVRQSHPKPSSRPARVAEGEFSGSKTGAPQNVVTRDLDVARRPADHGNVFPVGQFKGLTFWDVVFDQTGYYHHSKKHAPKSPYYDAWLNWVDKYFVVGSNGILLRDVPAETVQSRDLLVSRETGRRKPPNPPLPQKCQECRDFTKQGSTGYTIRKTCLTCGHSETIRRDMTPMVSPENCPHDDTDHRGSSKSVHRTFCKKCCTFIDEAPIEVRRERVAIAKKVETASVRTLPIVESLVEETPDGLTPVQLEELMPRFATLVSETCQSEAMTSARLHELLHQAISEVTEEDSFSLVDDVGHHDPGSRGPAGYVGICLHGSDSHYPQDLVYMNFETVDVAKSPHVFAVLDEGCNSTCHSKSWAVDAEARLARLGYHMPLKDDGCKSFAGLGSGNTKTEGVRSIPFSLLLPDGNMNGELDSHQLSTGNSPFLLSLHAQTKLGLVKDLEQGIITIKKQTLNVKRCAKSGLLVLNLTEGLKDLTQIPVGEVPTGLAKCHRKYKLKPTAYTADTSTPELEEAMTSDATGYHTNVTGYHSTDFQEIQQKVNEALNGETQIIIVTRGRRFAQHRLDSGRSTMHMGCEDLHDPNESGDLRPHIGWHKAILKGLCGLSRFGEHINSILEFVRDHKNDRILVDLTCKSGRHRSVGEGFTVLHCVRALGYEAELIHTSSWKWTEMRCGGVCRDCNDIQASLKEIQHLIPRVQPVTIRARGSVASSRSRPAETSSSRPSDVRDKIHAQLKKPAATSAASSAEIAEIKQLVDGLAKSIDSLKKDREEKRSRTPLKRRPRLPTPPRAPRRRSQSARRIRLRSPERGRSSPQRGRSPPVRRPPLRPQEPDHPPPAHRGRETASAEIPEADRPRAPEAGRPRTDRSTPSDREEIERLVRDNLALGGPFNNRNVSVSSMNADLLNEVVDLCIREGNRDRLFWVCDPGEDPTVNGVRMNVLIRAAIRESRINKAPMNMTHWKRSTWSKPRGSEGPWTLIEDSVDNNARVHVANAWSDVIVFHHPPGVYEDSGRGAYMSVRARLTPKKNDFEKSIQPVESPKERKMLAVKSKAQPKVDLTPKTECKSEPAETESYEYESSESSFSGFMAVRFESDGNLTVHPDERRTMNKKHRKSVLEGISQLNKHDRVMQSSFGMQSQLSDGTKEVAIITSHPALFQDFFEHTYDVGVNAAYLDGDAGTTSWGDMFEGCKLIVVAIEYKTKEYPLSHGELAYELEQYCDVTGCKYLIIDVAQTERWESFKTPQIPHINEVGLAFVSNDDELIQGFQTWSTFRQMDDVLTWDFCQWIRDWSLDRELEDQMSVAFPAEVVEEAEEYDGSWDAVVGPEDAAVQDPVEDLTHEETLLDDVDIPGLPEDEAERRRAWRKLPQRVRIAVRRLHRAFGHVPKSVMINLVRAAKVRKEFVDAVKLHRCETCEKTSPKKPTHKVTLPSDYTFNHTLGIDLLELTDVTGQKYQILNMVCVGTCFQQAEIVKVGAGQASSRSCLDALMKRWFSWAGHPVAIQCDRGLHNRGVLQQYMDEHNIQVYHVPLESPESLGRTERHGGLLKALFRRVCTEVGASSKEQVESCLTQVLCVKNDSARVGGFSPSQWVLGRAPRGVASIMSEEDHAHLGALEARHDPSSIFALQHLARIEAQKAFVHLDCSRRVQRALTRNASAFDRQFNVGDLVTFRHDNQRGGTSWSPTSRVIGHENQKNIWLLCGNVPVLVASHNVRIATPSEALAQSVLNGEPVIPYTVINDSGQQAFLDARQADEVEVVRDDNMDAALPPVPEEADEDWDLHPSFFEEIEDEEDEGGSIEDELSPPSDAARGSRVERVRSGEAVPDRNVRPRVEAPQPESERGSSLVTSRRDSQASGVGQATSSSSNWPARRELLDDLPLQLREHLERARERDSARSSEEQAEARAMFTTFLSQEIDGIPEDDEPGKKVLKSIHYETAPPEVQKHILEARTKEWSKFLEFGAIVEVSKEDAEKLIAEGHQCIPSKWVDVDKNQFMKGRGDQEYVPKFKSRLVSCGNFEVSEGLRSDSPTADTDAHNILCCWAAIQGAQLHSADVASAYFQGRPLDRVLIMRQPRGGLPGVAPEVFFLVRVPVYGLTDSGRGFWLQLDGDARASGLKQSKFYPGLYFLPGKDKDCVALMATHVDDILYAYIPEGRPVIESFLKKFNLGSTESNSFRYCGKQFERLKDGTITQDTRDNTRRIKPIKIATGRPLSEPLGKDDITRLRSVTGSLAWVTRQTRPDLGYRVSRLQSSISGATVATLADANAVVHLAQQGIENKLIFPGTHLKWMEIGIITVTDASFSNEKNFKSQQGRFHFLGDIHEIKNPRTTSYRVMPLGYSSSTIRRVCRSTLQCEAYSLQAGQESGDKLRGCLAELMGQLDSMKTWLDVSRSCIPHLMLSDCRSLTDHLANEVLGKVADKRLAIELQSIHESLWEDGRKTWDKYYGGGDMVTWIATGTMVSDALTKSMKPDLIIRVLQECVYRVQKQQKP